MTPFGRYIRAARQPGMLKGKHWLPDDGFWWKFSLTESQIKNTESPSSVVFTVCEIVPFGAILNESHLCYFFESAL